MDDTLTRLIKRLDEFKQQGWGKELPDDVVQMLREIWDALEGYDDWSMNSRKLHRDRIEDPTWDPPVLQFMMERHGSIMLGSLRAELQYWAVNLRDRTATCCEGGYRQLYRREPPLRVQPICDHVVDLITRGVGDECLKWSKDRTRVTFRIGKLIPADGFKQTVAGRRRRLRKVLEPALIERGWHPVPHTTAHTYERRTEA